LGEKGIADGFIDHQEAQRPIEDPQGPAHAARPVLEKIFKGSIMKDRSKRDRAIREAVERYGYTQRAVGDHRGTHFTYASRILSGR
jgi:hypothetical protein